MTIPGDFKIKGAATVIVLLLSLLLSCKETNTNDIEWIYVEGGEFTMGLDHPLISPKGDSIPGYTIPERQVRVNGFYISKYEITVAQFREFCRQTGRSMPAPLTEDSYGREVDFTWQDAYPMLLTWNEADAYAKWVGGRLPTEAEWEYAAKGGIHSKGYDYSGSDSAMTVGWIGENSDSSFHKPGLLLPNELGIYDMTGNLHEWVSDWWNPEFDYSTGPQVNPTGPPSGEAKISKGVGWYYNGNDAFSGKPLRYSIHRPEVRYQSGVDVRTFGFGARVVRDAK